MNMLFTVQIHDSIKFYIFMQAVKNRKGKYVFTGWYHYMYYDHNYMKIYRHSFKTEKFVKYSSLVIQLFE